MEKPRLRESVRYAFTITLKPHLYKKTSTEQYDIVTEDLYKYFNNYGICKYSLVAEETKCFNLHYHGTMSIFQCQKDREINIRKKFVDSFRQSKHFGFVNITQIDNEDNWKEYISKTFKVFKDNTGRRPILKDDFDYWSPIEYAEFGTEW